MGHKSRDLVVKSFVVSKMETVIKVDGYRALHDPGTLFWKNGLVCFQVFQEVNGGRIGIVQISVHECEAELYTHMTTVEELGSELANIFADCEDYFGISDKELGVTADEARPKAMGKAVEITIGRFKLSDQDRALALRHWVSDQVANELKETE